MNKTSAASLRLGLLCIIAVGIWAVYLKSFFVGFMADPIWYLEPARNFARGWGLVSRLLVPAQVAEFPLGFHTPVAYLHHGPVAPLLIGLGYKLFGLVDWVPLAISFALTLLSGLALYRLAYKIAGEACSLLAAFFFWSSYFIMEGNYGALADPPFILLITAAFLFLWNSAGSKRRELWLGAAGLAVGLASCTRLAGQAYWVGFAVGVFWLHRSGRALAFFIGALILPLVPLALYNHGAAGIYFYSPGFYILNWSPSFPGFRSSTSYMSMTTLQAVRAYPRDFLQKAITGPAYAVNRLLENAANPYLMACVFFGLMTDFKAAPPAERFKRLVWIVAAPVFISNAVISYGAVHYLNPLLPVFSILAALFLRKFVADNGRWLKPWFWLGPLVFALLFVSPLALQIKDNWKTLPQRRALYHDQVEIGAFVRERTAPNEVIYTDSNRMVVWQADRAAISLPATRKDAEKTLGHLPADALLLTSQRIHSEDYDQSWRDAFYGKKPIMGFVPCAEIATSQIRALLYRRPGHCT